MNDKTKSVTDELRLAAKSAAPYAMAMIGASHLNKAADTIDTLRTENTKLHSWLIAAEQYRGHLDRARFEAVTLRAENGRLRNEIDTLRTQLAEAQRDSERLDWMIEYCAYVVSDPDCCDGYWLNYPRPDGTLWTQATEHETPRAAIDAAKGEKP